MVEKSQLFFSSFTNKKGVTKISANFTIEFAKDTSGVHMTLAWEKTIVSIPIR